MNKIVIAGTGYVGLVTGVGLAEHGNQVICVDIDETRVNKMQLGIPPIYEKDLAYYMKKNLDEKRLTFTTDYKTAYQDADIIFIAVGTPETEDGSADLTYVYNVADQIVETITNDCLVVVKSTVPMGTNELLERYLQERVADGIMIEVASNPEFLAQGTAVHDILHGDRIVIGANSEEAKNKLVSIYESFTQPIITTDCRSAEMIKYASNAFLSLKVSFINEIANLCELVGADIEDVASGMGYDNRIGNKFLKAGIGYGGSCFPKDTKALVSFAKDNDYDMKTVQATIEVNELQKIKLFNLAKEKLGNFNGLKVAVLGLTYKPGTDDYRDAPSIDNIKCLLQNKANVVVYDPIGMDNYQKLFSRSEIEYCNSIEETLKEADVCFIFTEWDEIKAIEPKTFKELMNYPLVYDGRNCYAVEDMIKIEYYSIGRSGTRIKVR